MFCLLNSIRNARSSRLSGFSLDYWTSAYSEVKVFKKYEFQQALPTFGAIDTQNDYELLSGNSQLSNVWAGTKLLIDGSKGDTQGMSLTPFCRHVKISP